MSENVKIILGYIVICLLWGSTWLAIRLGLDDMTPVLSAGIRFLLASIFIYALMKLRGVKVQTDKKSIRLFIVLSFFSYSIPFGLLYWAEQHIESALASLLFGFYPFTVILFSKLMMPDQKIGPYQALAVLFGFIGVGIIFSENLSLDFSANMLAVIAAVASAVIQGWVAVLIKRDGEHLNPLSMNLIPILGAGLAMTVFAFLFEDLSGVVFTQKAILSIIYLAFFGTLTTFTIFYWLMKRINVVILSLVSFITPIISVVLGYFVLNERLSAQTLVGGGVVLVGILLANLRGLKKYFKVKRAEL